MSLVLVWKEDDFIAVACDGLALKAKDKDFVRIDEKCRKFWVLTPHVAVASVGLNWMGEAIASSLARMAVQLADDPRLFSVCEQGVPLIARQLLDKHPPKTSEENLTVTLAGFDALQDRVRCVSWLANQGLEPRELTERGRVMGYEAGQDVAKVLLGVVLDTHATASPSDVGPLLEGIVRQTASAVPNFVGGQVSSVLIRRGL